jgi:hypothetical protein
MKQLSHDLYRQNKDREFNAVENIAHAVNKVTTSVAFNFSLLGNGEWAS